MKRPLWEPPTVVPAGCAYFGAVAQGGYHKKCSIFGLVNWIDLKLIHIVQNACPTLPTKVLGF